MLICFSKLTRSVLLFRSVPFAPFCFFSSISSSSSSSSSSSALDSFGRWLLLDALMLGVSSINKSLKLKQQKSRRKKVVEREKWEAKTQWNGISFHAHEHMIACASLCFVRWLSEPGARREKEEASGRAKRHKRLNFPICCVIASKAFSLTRTHWLRSMEEFRATFDSTHRRVWLMTLLSFSWSVDGILSLLSWPTVGRLRKSFCVLSDVNGSLLIGDCECWLCSKCGYCCLNGVLKFMKAAIDGVPSRVEFCEKHGKHEVKSRFASVFGSKRKVVIY